MLDKEHPCRSHNNIRILNTLDKEHPCRSHNNIRVLNTLDKEHLCRSHNYIRVLNMLDKEHPCRSHNNIRVFKRSIKSIHAGAIITSEFLIRSIRSSYAGAIITSVFLIRSIKSIHAEAIITSVFLIRSIKSIHAGAIITSVFYFAARACTVQASSRAGAGPWPKRLLQPGHGQCLAEAVIKTTCVRVSVCVWLCLCVPLSEHVQTPMLKRLRARETTAAAQFAGFFSQFFLLPARPPGLRALQNMPRLPVILTLLHACHASRRAFTTRRNVVKAEYWENGP